jgi:hypothetical protein
LSVCSKHTLNSPALSSPFSPEGLTWTMFRCRTMRSDGSSDPRWIVGDCGPCPRTRVRDCRRRHREMRAARSSAHRRPRCSGVDACALHEPPQSPCRGRSMRARRPLACPTPSTTRHRTRSTRMPRSRDQGHGSRRDFVDPRERLVDEYQRAVEDLRRDLGDPQTLGEKWRFWRARRRLWKEKVVLPARSAKW